MSNQESASSKNSAPFLEFIEGLEKAGIQYNVFHDEILTLCKTDEEEEIVKNLHTEFQRKFLTNSSVASPVPFKIETPERGNLNG